MHKFFRVFGNEIKKKQIKQINNLRRFTMTLFEAINKFLSGNSTTIIVEKADVDNYGVIFRRFDRNPGFKSELRSREIGKNITDVFVSAAEGTDVGGNITVTESERKILNKIAEIIDDYSPFLRFYMIHTNRNSDKGEINDYYSAYFDGDYYPYHGQISASADKMDVESVISDSITKARLDLKNLDKNNTMAAIADYIKYENSSDPNVDAEVIIRKKDKEFSVFIRSNNISQNKYINLSPSVEKRAGYLQRAVENAIEANNELTEWPSGYTYLSKAKGGHNYSLNKIADVLDKLKNENIVFRVCENKNTKTKKSSVISLKAEFRNASSGELLAESCDNNIRKAVFDASKKMIKLYCLPSKPLKSCCPERIFF